MEGVGSLQIVLSAKLRGSFYDCRTQFNQNDLNAGKKHIKLCDSGNIVCP